MSMQPDNLQFEFTPRQTIKGFPEIHWTGKRPYRATQYFPAQLRERYGQDQDGWMNRLYWGDNLQVMSHLMKNFRGQVDLVYIDPPFDSKEEYKKKISLQGQTVQSDGTTFEEKQYRDIWASDAYLQFMYERLILLRELLKEEGAIYVHCDYHRSHQLRMVMDEVFGPENFRNEIIWCYKTSLRASERAFGRDHDTILFYAKSEKHLIHPDKSDFPASESTWKRWGKYADENGFVSNKHFAGSASTIMNTEDETKGFNINHGIPRDWWEISANVSKGNTDEVKFGKYPTQKPEEILERIIKASSKPGDLVMDCFMGSGTMQAVAMGLGRRFIGADINLGAIQTATRRLVDLLYKMPPDAPGFELYNVNHYDFFRNPVEARELILQALEIQPAPQGSPYDGELDGRMVKLMPVDRIATRADLEELRAALPYQTFERRRLEAPTQPVERLTLVCMGHEPDLKAVLEQEMGDYRLDVEILDILRDRNMLQLKREAEAEVVREGDKLVIRSFYPMNLLQKLEQDGEYVDNWKQLVESVMIDWNYDGAVMQPTITDVPGRGQLVDGEYAIPHDAGVIMVKITDLLSESLEVEVR